MGFYIIIKLLASMKDRENEILWSHLLIGKVHNSRNFNAPDNAEKF